MITNKEIANTFNDLAKIMELHKENPYKIRSYQNAYVQLRKIEQPLVEMSDQEISGIKGVGKAISSKIRELQDSGTLATLEKYKAKTPPGIQDLLGLKGFGPKKIRTLWDELGIESAGELLYACNENRLIELKGFGHKTQEDLRQKLEYFLQSKNKFHYASLEREALLLIEQLQEKLPAAKIELTGAIRRRATILDRIELLIASKAPIDSIFDGHLLSLDKQEEQL
ncbi:MAG: helix-hairpin-helix domain-containing protein [Bacteroidota bacterium]